MSTPPAASATCTTSRGGPEVDGPVAPDSRVPDAGVDPAPLAALDALDEPAWAACCGVPHLGGSAKPTALQAAIRFELLPRSLQINDGTLLALPAATLCKTKKKKSEMKWKVCLQLEKGRRSPRAPSHTREVVANFLMALHK